MNKKYPIILIVCIVLAGFIGYELGHKQTAVYSQNNTSDTATFKKDIFGGDIPANWSLLTGGMGAVDNPADLSGAQSVMESFAPNFLQYSDWNAGQVDVYILTGSVEQSLLASAQQESDKITTEKVNSLIATVVTFPLSAGGVANIEQSGGQEYFIDGNQLKATSPSDAGTFLLIKKQTAGDEDIFQYFLGTANFSQGW